MKTIKKRIALILSACLILTSIIPAYADEANSPIHSAVQEEISSEEIPVVAETATVEIVEPQETTSEEIICEDETILENIEKATPANADYIEHEESQDDPDIDVFEEATPANAKYTDEKFIRATVVDGIKITLTADSGVFPEGAELLAEKVKDTDIEEAIDKAIEEEKRAEEVNNNIASRLQFDIKMLLNGEEIQPDTTKGTVKISFALEEVLNNCLDVNVYHVTGENDDLTAEILTAEVETDDEVNLEDDEVLIDDSEDILSEEITEGIVVTAETDGFSYYVVEFTYINLQYVLNGDESVKLSTILAELELEGTVTNAEVSNKELFTVTEDEDGKDWTVTALQAFSTEEWMKVTIDGQVYEIAVTDAIQYPISYLYWDEEKKLVPAECTAYTVVTSADNYVFKSGEWYAVTSDVEINNRIENQAAANTPAHLILVDGKTLTATKGIHNPSGKGLVIYGQSEGTGALTISGVDDRQAGIGGGNRENGGNITIDGGMINSKGGEEGAGIGGGDGGDGGNITINGGTVTADGNYYNYGRGAGLGGGFQGNGENVTINGGTVIASGGIGAAGIGAGNEGNGGTITINDGAVTTNGGGYEGDGGGAGIGGGLNGDGANVTISGGVVSAAGGYLAPAIGGGIWDTRPNNPGSLSFRREPSMVKGDDNIISAGQLILSVERKATAYSKVYIEYGKANFTVEHMWQTELFGSNYVLHEHETQTGYLNNDTDAKPKNYDGYVTKSITNVPMKEDGTAVAVIYYDIYYSTITFNVNGRGTEPQPLKNIPGADISGNEPQLTVEGYIFGGWYTEKECTNPFTFSTMPENSMTLYAKWTVDPSKLQDIQYVDADGSTQTASCIIMSDAQNFAFEEDKWYAVTGNVMISNRIENMAATDTPAHLILVDGCTLTPMYGIHNPGSKGLVIYGQSEGTGSLTITDGGADNAGIGSAYGESVGNITINGGNVTVHGGHFAEGIGRGCNGHSDGNVTINRGNVTVKGGDFESAIGGYVFITGGTMTADGGWPGWSGISGTIESDKNPAELKAGADKESAVDMDFNTYKANCDKYPYVYISYVKAEYQVKHMLQKEICGDEYELKDTETLSGYVNSMTEATARDIYSGYEPLLPIEQKTIMAEGTVVEIRYNLIYHTVTFDANGHGTTPEPVKALPGTTIAAPKDPSAEGYVFGGWYTDSACTKTYDFKTPVTSDITLYAKWTKRIYKKYTITWMLNDIKPIDTTEVLEGEMPVHENPEREGYIFVGWKPALAPVTGNAKYTAYFKEREVNKVAVTFNTNGGTFIDTQIIDRDTTPERPADPQKKGCEFEGWYREAGFITPYEFDEPVNTDMPLYAKWKVVTKYYEITWQDWNKKEFAITLVEEGNFPKYPGTSNPSRSGYIFTGWTPGITRAYADQTYTAAYRKMSNGGGTVSSANRVLTYSPNWYLDAYGIWRIRNSAGQTVVNAWLCDDAVTANGQNVWYLFGADGAMIAAGLVQDKTGNFYSLETEHTGHYGSLRYKNGYYNCNGQQVYLTFHQAHDGSFGAITNPEGIEKLKAIYGVTRYGIGNENAVYTATF